jgi:hypothetical protein
MLPLCRLIPQLLPLPLLLLLLLLLLLGSSHSAPPLRLLTR